MASAYTSVAITFPGGSTSVDFSATDVQLLAVELVDAAPRAELTFFAAPGTASTDFRQVCTSDGKPFIVPVGRGGQFSIPQELRSMTVGAILKFVLTNFGSSTVNLRYLAQ